VSEDYEVVEPFPETRFCSQCESVEVEYRYIREACPRKDELLNADPGAMVTIDLRSPYHRPQSPGAHLHWACLNCFYKWSTRTAQAEEKERARMRKHQEEHGGPVPGQG
jgi:hypothetical protein